MLKIEQKERVASQSQYNIDPAWGYNTTEIGGILD